MLILFSFLHANIVITEVSPNPQGGSGEIPGDLSHEFIEFLNCGPDTVNLCQYYIQSGSWGSTTLPDSNNIQVWQGDSLCDIGCGTFLEYDSLLAPGEYAVLLGRKYVSAPESSWYRFPAGTHLFATRKTYLRSGGLANASTWVRLFSANNIQVSSFNAFGSTTLDPGEGVSWQRIFPDSSDAVPGWRQALPTPGAPFPCSASRFADTTIVINEFMCDPAADGAEWIELYNYGDDPVSLQGWRIKTGDIEGFVTLSGIHVPPHGYCIVREPGTFNDGFFNDCLAPVIPAQNWDGLRRDADGIVIRNSEGRSVDSLQYKEGWFGIQKGVSLERIVVHSATNATDNWRHSVSAKGATPGYGNSAAAAPEPFSFILVNRRLVPGSADGRASLNMLLNVPPGGRLTLKIYDLKGRLVRGFFDNASGVTERYLVWDGASGEGMRVPSGLYLLYCCFSGAGQDVQKKIPIAVGGAHGAD